MQDNPDHPKILLMNEFFFKKLRFVLITDAHTSANIPSSASKV
jgi:hypothetical protein